MTLQRFWSQTDSEQAAWATSIRRDARIPALYQHALAFESWRQNLLTAHLGPGLPFWYEAQNDYLLSLVHGGRGIWRSSLQALRSFVENAASAIYYSEHPVEAKRFEAGAFRLTWTGIRDYFEAYPYDSPLAFRTSLWNSFASEYRLLSQAVHGSAEAFRMTEFRRFPVLGSDEPRLIGGWKTRSVHCARAVHLLLIQHFVADLAGARLPGLREDLGRTLPAGERARVRRSLSVVLPTP